MIRCAAMGLLLWAACAPSRTRLLEERAGTYVFQHSGDEVTLAVTALLEERGFEWAPPRPDGVRRTAWKQVYGDEQFATVSERYFVRIKRLGPSHATLEVVKLSQSTAGMETHHPTLASNTGRAPKDVGGAEPMGTGTAPLPMGPPVARRALELEWELIQRLEPSRAAALENRVDATASR